jgi:hypothetical protein
MRKLIILFLTVSLLASCTGRVTLFKKDKLLFNIAISSKSDSLTIEAAGLLKTYIYKITGADVQVIKDPADDLKYIYLGKDIQKEDSVTGIINNLKNEGFIIDIDQNRIILAGKSGQADIFAVTTFLEEYLGCMKFTGTEEYIPSAKTFSLPVISKKYEPAFEFRHPHFQDRQNRDYLNWHKLNSFSDWGLFVHTFQRLLPPEKYFDKHPEYFSLVNGKRIRDGQLCLSNPKVIELLGDNLALLIAEQPAKTYCFTERLYKLL